MRKFSMMVVAALGVATVSVPTVASAQPWQSVSERKHTLERRIDQGIRSGALTRSEAQRVRTELRSLIQLENRYRRSEGRLTNWERRDLNQRYDRLSARVKYEKRDRDTHRRR